MNLRIDHIMVMPGFGLLGRFFGLAQEGPQHPHGYHATLAEGWRGRQPKVRCAEALYIVSGTTRTAGLCSTAQDAWWYQRVKLVWSIIALSLSSSLPPHVCVYEKIVDDAAQPKHVRTTCMCVAHMSQLAGVPSRYT